MLQGSQNQLKEVWEEADGLDPEDFDPKTFFNLHGKTNTYRQLSLYLVIIRHITDRKYEILYFSVMLSLNLYLVVFTRLNQTLCCLVSCGENYVTLYRV